MKKWLFGIGSFVVMAGLSFAGTSLLAGGNKVTICHVPPGNPANAHTISISVNALKAHLGENGAGLHGGDAYGECVSSTLDPCDQSSSLDGCVDDGIYY